MCPALGKGVAGKNFFQAIGGRRIEAEKLNVVPRVSFVNRDDVRGIKIERRQPFLFLLRRPVRLDRGDIVIRFGGPPLERAGCVH